MDKKIVDKKCAICNKTLNHNYKVRQYCSPACRIALKEKIMLEKSTEKICPNCNTAFKSSYSTKKYCSPICASENFSKVHRRP